jgi:hypothetical protein
MFFFFPFAGMQTPSAGRSFSPLPLLPAPKSFSSSASEGFNFWGFPAGFLRRSLETCMSSLTALGGRANALFAQVAAALAFDRIASSATAFVEAAFSGFGAPHGGLASFGFPWQAQDWLSNAPSAMSNAMSPWGANPWAAFSEGFAFWTDLWAPMLNGAGFSDRRTVTPAFKAKVSTPAGFSWAFAMDA